MEATEREIKDREYKEALLLVSRAGINLPRFIQWEIMDHDSRAFDLMEEAQAEFTKEGYEKAAKFLLKQLKNGHTPNT